MLRFLIHRTAGLAAVLAILSFLVYAMIGLMPGDPIDLMISSNPELTPADAERLRQVYGLDRPLLERYVAWAGDILAGDFGYSRTYRQPVAEILLPRLGNTLVLMGLSLLLSLAIAIPAGIWAATRPNSVTDYAVNLFCFAGVSVPPFWLALLLMLLFSVTLGWLPASGSGAITTGFADWLSYQLMPVLTLAAAGTAVYTRHTRAAMREQLRLDYVRTARAKGAARNRVLLRHALRNAMIPVVTVLALDFGTLFSGALITEQMFAYLGMGKTIFDAIMGNDYNLALAALLLATVAVLVANLVADLAYVWLDPRIRLR